MDHQPCFRIPSGLDCFLEIVPTLLARADDVCTGTDFHSDRLVRKTPDSLDDAIRIGIASVHEFAVVSGD